MNHERKDEESQCPIHNRMKICVHATSKLGYDSPHSAIQRYVNVKQQSKLLQKSLKMELQLSRDI